MRPVAALAFALVAGVVSAGEAGGQPGATTSTAAIPGGSFQMGHSGAEVAIARFDLEVSPVTAAAYDECVSAGACSPPPTGGRCNAGLPERGDHPANCVRWSQADAYCRWKGMRLPTEEELEWALRSGGVGNDAPVDVEARACRHGGRGGRGPPAAEGSDEPATCPVRAPGRWVSSQGVRDLIGNLAWQWTSSCADPRCERRVLRGGDAGTRARLDLPQSYPATGRGEWGFRCAKERPPGDASAERAPEHRGAVRLPPGRYDFDGWTRDGGARRRAQVASFLMDETEVTVGAYGRCVARGACAEPLAGGACNWRRPDRADHPVNCVTWSQAAAYCAWAGKRLPYEAEWEWAARGGDLGHAYPWGGLPPAGQLCWNGEGNDQGKAKRRGTCRVGTYPEGDTALGLKDMAGNVWEWMADLDDDGQPAGLHRGGGWDTGGGWRFSVQDDAPRQLSASSRAATADATLARDWLGFRCVSSP